MILVEPEVFYDKRGFFMEAYKKKDYEENGLPGYFVQENHSASAKGTMRGLHYQKDPMSQGKLMRVVQGKIFDVAVDIRIGSPTYGRYITCTLSSENKHALYIPPGFAHGFCTQSKEAFVTYHTTEMYAPEFERGIIWNDPEIGINWPVRNPILSKKDASYPSLSDADNNYRYEGNII